MDVLPPRAPHAEYSRAFTLVEVLVASVVLLLLVGMILTVTSNTGATIGRTSAKIDTFAASRAAFDLITQRLSQASLNTYYDYFDRNGRTASNAFYAGGVNLFNPASYGRQSDLQFLVLQNQQNAGYGQEAYFVTPRAYSNQSNQLATAGLLNACSFFVQYGSDASFHPTLSASTPGPLPLRYRYRLMQGIQPTENLQVFQSVTASTPDLKWLQAVSNVSAGAPSSTVSASVAPLADNILALVIWPRLSEADDPNGTALSSAASPYAYTYDSRNAAIPHATSSAAPTPPSNKAAANQLPPGIRLTMIALSETSALRLGNSATAPATIENALTGKFADIGNYQSDLASVSAALVTAHLQFQVFSTTVPMRESKWTSSNP